MKRSIFFSALLLSTSVFTSVCSAQPGIIRTIGGHGVEGYSGDGGPATDAGMNPVGVAIDNSGNIYFTDYNNNRVRKISTSGTITTIAGNGSLGFSGDGAAATNAMLNLPTGVAVDASGNVFIADGNNNRIRKVDTSGIITTVAGSSVSSFGGDGGMATAAGLNGTYGVAIDASGDIYIADYNHQRIRFVNTSGVISTIAGTGIAGYSGDGIAATAAALNAPYDIAVDASGNVYIGDSHNQRIRKINSSGIISTVAGNGSAGYGGDGAAATTAMLSNPQEVKFDGSGNLYIGDRNNNVIRKVSTSGIITTFAGNNVSGFSGDGGFSTLAELSLPNNIAIDSVGNVYFADFNNYRIRMASPSITITGTPDLCAGSAITFADSTSGGTWSSGSASIATVGSATGVITGVAGGIATITYSVGTVTATKTITVDPLPAGITGTDTVCTGNTITLGDITTGGTWSSSAASVAIVGSATGIVAGVAAGIATITYELPTGCNAVSTIDVIHCVETGVAEIQEAGNAAIYPNPAYDELTIKTGSASFHSFTIINQLGQVLLQGQLTGAQTTADIKSLSSGLYYISLSGVDGNKVLKFIKQ